MPRTFFFIATLISASIACSILLFLIIPGFALFENYNLWQLITSPWNPDKGMYGIYPMLLGTFFIALISILISFPFSLGCSAFIHSLGPRPLATFLESLVRLMTGIPTVVYGFVGIFMMVPIIRELFDAGSGFCLLSAALLMAVLVSPTMILIFTEQFRKVPKTYSDACQALGGSRVQNLFFVILPNSKQAILGGAILALGRAVGDTLISLMLAGNSVAIPESIFESARTLTAHIALIIASDFESIEFKSIFLCGLTLYLFTTTLVIGIRLLEFLSFQNKDGKTI